MFSHLTYPFWCFCTTLQNRKPRNCVFSLKHHMLLCQRTHKTHLNYHLVAVELPFIPKVIDCMLQTIKTYLEREHSILLSVTHTLYVYQVCCRSLCKRWELFFVKPGVKVSGQYIVLSQQMSDAIKHITGDIFFSFRKTAHWCTCTVHATQSNCCSAVDFFSPEPCLPTAPS